MNPRDVSTLARRIVGEAVRGAIWAALEDAAVWEAKRDRIVREWAAACSAGSPSDFPDVYDAIREGSPSRIVARRLAALVEWYEEELAYMVQP